MTPQDVTSRYTGRAVDAALAQAAAGAHFLAGASGAKPGGSQGTRLHPAGVTIAPGRTDPIDPAVFAAQCVHHGPGICAGRFDARNGGIAGGRPAAITDTDLIVYLAGLAAQPPQEWKPFFQFFSPRALDGLTSDGLGGASRPQVVWGEDCRAKQHFDGAGLINWCLERAVEARYPITFDIATWATDASGTHAVTLTEPIHSGDIVLRETDGILTHIGLLCALGEGALGEGALGEGALGEGDGYVVLAEQPSTGVVRRRFRAAEWSARRRPSPELLHGSTG